MSSQRFWYFVTSSIFIEQKQQQEHTHNTHAIVYKLKDIFSTELKWLSIQVVPNLTLYVMMYNVCCSYTVLLKAVVVSVSFGPISITKT